MAAKQPNIIYSAGAMFSFPMLSLRCKLGAEGFGIYIMILELMMLNGGCIPADYNLIAFSINVDEEIVRSVVEDFNLFTIVTDETGKNFITEEKIEEWHESAENLKTRRAAAAKSRWERKQVKIGEIVSENKHGASEVKPKVAETVRNKVEASVDSVSSDYDYVEDTERILESEEWIAGECERLGLDPLTLREVMREFMKFTKGRGGKYAGRREYLQHFTRWSAGAGLDAAMMKVNERRKSRLEESRREKERLMREREWDESNRKAVKPWEYIRMKGYDPTRVTDIRNVGNPEWRVKNPPTLPIFATIEELRAAVG